MDQADWKCFCAGDLSVYYGQVAYLSPDGTLSTSETPVVLRHGRGVQLFRTDETSVHCKYEGDWHFNRKHGKGQINYSSGDRYTGELQFDKRHGWGQFLWSDGKMYEGGWNKDRMQGKGTFSHPSGAQYEGDFIADYFIQDDLMVNTLVPMCKLEQDIEQQREFRKTHDKLVETKQKEVNLHRIANLSELEGVLTRLGVTGRVPLVVVTSQSFLRRSDFYECLRTLHNEVTELDLVLMGSLTEERDQQIRAKVIEATTSGTALVVNLDDSPEEGLAPDLRELYSPTSFPPFLLVPKTFKSAQRIWAKFAAGEDLVLQSTFSLYLWSKFPFDEGLDDQDVLAKFTKTFSRTVPLDNIDCVLCHNSIQEEELSTPRDE